MYKYCLIKGPDTVSTWSCRVEIAATDGRLAGVGEIHVYASVEEAVVLWSCAESIATTLRRSPPRKLAHFCTCAQSLVITQQCSQERVAQNSANARFQRHWLWAQAARSSNHKREQERKRWSECFCMALRFVTMRICLNQTCLYRYFDYIFFVRLQEQTDCINLPRSSTFLHGNARSIKNSKSTESRTEVDGNRSTDCTDQRTRYLQALTSKEKYWDMCSTLMLRTSRWPILPRLVVTYFWRFPIHTCHHRRDLSWAVECNSCRSHSWPRNTQPIASAWRHWCGYYWFEDRKPNYNIQYHKC